MANSYAFTRPFIDENGKHWTDVTNVVSIDEDMVQMHAGCLYYHSEPMSNGKPEVLMVPNQLVRIGQAIADLMPGTPITLTVQKRLAGESEEMEVVVFDVSPNGIAVQTQGGYNVFVSLADLFERRMVVAEPEDLRLALDGALHGWVGSPAKAVGWGAD